MSNTDIRTGGIEPGMVASTGLICRFQEELLPSTTGNNVTGHQSERAQQLCSTSASGWEFAGPSFRVSISVQGAGRAN